MSFAGLRVLALESRRANEMAQLIRLRQGEPFVAPSMREAPLERNEQAFAFAERLFRGEFDMVILLTGVGTRFLNKLLESRYPPGRFAEALRTVTTVVRGPKPAAVLREMNVPITVAAPEPNTWREVLKAIESRSERRIAVQEYGVPNLELIAALERRGAEVTSVPVYQWELPEDIGPLREAGQRVLRGEIDVAIFTTSIQIDHLLEVSDRPGDLKTALAKTVIASIGPTTSEALMEHGLRPDFEPSHPKMGVLVQETAQRAQSLLMEKRQSP